MIIDNSLFIKQQMTQTDTKCVTHGFESVLHADGGGGKHYVQKQLVFFIFKV